MPEQLIFDLPLQTAFGRDDFFVSSANKLAVDMLEDWTAWPRHKLILCGAKGAGKSHLASIWAEATGAHCVSAKALAYERLETLAQHAVVVEDIHQISGDRDAEEALFHLHNLAQENGYALLMTSLKPAPDITLSLADLESRLGATQLVTLNPPDDMLLNVVLIKLFTDRQMQVDPALVGYLSKRMERSFDFAGRLVKSLDQASLKGQKPVTKRLAGQVLEGLLDQDRR